MKFDQYPLSETLKENIRGQGLNRPTDIQFKTIPHILGGEDVLAVAQTGTGKTAAFAIPIIERIDRWKKNKVSSGISCLVMVPTRELAQQIGKVFSALSVHTKANVFSLYGGVEQEQQVRQIKGGLDILITTPGRMFDLIHQGHLEVNKVRTLVLDEADRMLDLGFIDDIGFVKTKLPKKHQTLFFSATLNRNIKKLAYSQVRGNAIRIELSPKDPVSKRVEHAVMFIEKDHKRFFLESFIRDHEDEKVLIFVRTRVRAERVQKAMDRVAIECGMLHGEMTQGERMSILDRFREGGINRLIATDISARGIDIPGVGYVINFDLPEIPEQYVHRVGRTGRGKEYGIGLTLCSPEEEELLEAIEKEIGSEIPESPVSKRSYKEIVKTFGGTSKSDKVTFEDLESFVLNENFGTDRRDKKPKSKKKKKS